VPIEPKVAADLETAGWAAVHAIALDLASAPIGEHRPGLADGHAGIALFFDTLAEATGERALRHRADAHLEAAVDGSSACGADVGLFTGATGVAWAMAHLARVRGDSADEELVDIDAVLVAHLATRTPCHDNFDLVAGLVGIGVYGLERLPHPVGRELVAAVLARLERLAEHRHAGACWRVQARNIPLPSERARHPEGRLDFGLSHGVAGVLAFLAAVALADVERARATALLDAGVRWLLAQPRPRDAETAFAMTEPEEPPVPARSAWCYGDPSIAVALVAASRALVDPSLASLGLGIAARDAQRPLARSGVQDASLCHGAAGQALVHDWLLRHGGDERHAAASRLWLERALRQRRPGLGVGGFLRRRYRVVDEVAGSFAAEDFADPGLLEGAAGVGLSLLALLSPPSRRWGQLFLCNNLPGDR
jgi:lantibiotic modifying enzyme